MRQQYPQHPSMDSNEVTVPLPSALRRDPPTQLSPHYPSMDHNGHYLFLCTGTLSDGVLAMPIFHPSPAAASGLDLLAAAAAATPTHMTNPATTTSLVSAPGPFNPAASMPMKVVKRILDMEFVEMSEISIDDDTTQTPGRPPAPARLPVTEISQWVERYSLMAAVLTTRFQAKAPELLAYQATIVRAERNYEGKRWVSYDRQFRREF